MLKNSVEERCHKKLVITGLTFVWYFSQQQGLRVRVYSCTVQLCCFGCDVWISVAVIYVVISGSYLLIANSACICIKTVVRNSNRYLYLYE